MEKDELKRILTAVLFAAGEPVEVRRISDVLQADEGDIHEAARELADEAAFTRSGLRILRLENAYQMCSAPEQAEYVARILETRKPPKLSASQLEVLTVIAYYQPTTKAFIEQLRGVDSSYSVSALLTKGLIEECGRLSVPGRPIQYRTTPDFLRTFGLQSLDELPEIQKISVKAELPEQLSYEDVTSAPADAPTEA